MKKYIFIAFLFMTTCFFSCEKIVDNVDLPQQEPKLVVHCYISPEDTLIKAHVYLSVPIFSNYNIDEYSPVTNATVKITDFSQEATLIYDGIEKYVISTSAFSILPNNTYKITVSAPGYKAVEASCKVPAYTNETLQIIAIDSIKSNDYNTEYKFKIEFTDRPGIGDFYRLSGNVTTVYDDGSGTNIDTSEYMLYPKYGQEFFSDKNNDGQKMLSEMNYYKYSYYEEGYGGERIIGLKFHLLVTDEHYYKYHKSLSNYSGDDPFSEPTIIYSNMQNGLGVFGAYRKFTVNSNFSN